MPWSRVQDLDNHWNDLIWKFEHILDGNIIKQDDWFLCFTQVFQLLTSVDTDSLDKIHERLYSFFRNYLAKIAKRLNGEEEDQLLYTYRKLWIVYRDNLQKISQVFGTLLFEPYRSSSLPSALYLPSLTNSSDEIQSDADISSVYDIGVLYWQNVVVKPNSERLIRVLTDAIKSTWKTTASDDPMDTDQEIGAVIVDVARTFSQKPGQKCVAIRGLNVTSTDPVHSHDPSGVSAMINPAHLLVGPLLAVQSSFRSLTGELNNSGSETNQLNNLLPARSFVQAYHNLLREYAMMSHKLDMSQNVDRSNLSQLSRFILLEHSRIERIFEKPLVVETVTLMEYLFFGGDQKQAIETFLANEAQQHGLCPEVAQLFSMISVLPLGRKTAISVMANYISGLSKVILENRPADVSSSPESFVNYFGGQLMQLRKTVEATFTANGMSQSLDGAVTRAAEEVLAKLSAENLCPEDFSARYIDVVLKKSSSLEPNSPEFQKKLDSFIGMFTYLTEKTLYQKLHAKFLFRRLVLGLSPSLELERSVNRSMTEICSSEYCVYLNRTLIEVEKSFSLTKDYASVVAGDESSGVTAQQASKFSALVLSQHIWPLGPAPVPSLKLPRDLQKHIDEFSSFYTKRKDRSKLTWLNGYGIVEMRLLFAQPKPVTLVANAAYASVLLLFSDADTRSAAFLSESTGLTKEELNRVCSNLVDQKLLICQDSSSSSSFTLNLNFTSRSKIRLLTLGGSAAAAAAAQAKSQAADTSMDFEPTSSTEGLGRSALIEKFVLESKEHMANNFTCMDMLRCILARPELKFSPSPNEVHLCLQRLRAMDVVEVVSHDESKSMADSSQSIKYKFCES